MTRTLIAFILLSFCLTASAEDATKATGGNKPGKSEELPLAIDGYCAVSIVEPSVMTKGEEKFQVIYEGLRYLFLSEEEKLMFEASPKKYAIAYNGLDLVATYGQEVSAGEELQKVFGSRKFIGRHEERTYLFSTLENAMVFNRQPHSYVQKAERMEELETRIRRHEQKRGKTMAELYPALEAN